MVYKTSIITVKISHLFSKSRIDLFYTLGTFLFDNEFERKKENISTRTVSLW